MSAIEFTAQSGKTFSLQLYNATTLAAIGTPLAPTGVGGIYRVSTGANTGIVYVEATATNLLVAGFANLDSASANGYSPLRDTYDEAATPLASLDSSLDAAKGATFDTTTDSLEAIRNRGDAAWATGAGGTTNITTSTTVIEAG